MAANSEGAPRPRDDQQAKLVESLRAAGGAPVDFEELRAIGIEHPAVVSYELEAAGVPIIQTRGSNRRALAIEQLIDPVEGAAEGAPGVPGEGPPTPASSSPARSSLALQLRARVAGRLRVILAWLAGARAPTAWLQATARRVATARTARRVALTATPALAVALTVGIATLLFDETGRARAGRETARAGVTAHRPAGPGGGQAARVSAAGPAEAVAPVARVPEVSGVAGAPGASSPAAAGALDLEGHHLLSEGRYPAAIDDLMRAIRASGRSLDGCMEPTSESCLTFAYALYDLGRALRLDDNPAAALPILTERLRIDNQRQVVQHELELARGAGT